MFLLPDMCMYVYAVLHVDKKSVSKKIYIIFTLFWWIYMTFAILKDHLIDIVMKPKN